MLLHPVGRGLGAGFDTMNKNAPAYIARRKISHGTGERVSLQITCRRQHTYIIGKTGQGKSTILRNLAIQDIAARRTVGFIDPHGDDAEELLEHIPKSRTKHLRYVNPADLSHPIGLNILECPDPEDRHLVVSNVVSAFKNIWADSWGPRMEYIMANALATLIEHGHSTLLDLPKLLTNDRYRERVISRINDPVIRSFWVNEYERYDKRFRTEAVSPILNKINRFLSSAMMRNIFAQTKSTIDIPYLMDNDGILIANLSKGKIGEDNANLLGSLLVSRTQLAAMRRAYQKEYKRKDFCLHIDEFHNFTSRAFINAMAEVRKYRLSLTLVAQYGLQTSDEILRAILANAGTVISFRCGAEDAERLEKHFGGDFKARQFTDLDRHEVLITHLEDGKPTVPFKAITDRPITRHRKGRGEVVKRSSRERYARPRSRVERSVRLNMGVK